MSECPICRQPSKVFGEGDYYLSSRIFRDKLFNCAPCDIVYRQKSEDELEQHFEAASYTRDKNEQRFYEQRRAYFEYLGTITSAHVPANAEWMDFGCAYGHFMQVLRDRGHKLTGIELNDHVRKLCENKGFPVYKSLQHLPEEKKFDVISSIDSFYCVPEPRDLLAGFHANLKDDGILLIRITNRVWITKLMKNMLGKSYFKYLLGDATISYTLSGMRKLLNDNGWKIQKVVAKEGGKKGSLKVRAFYNLTEFITTVTACKLALSPGLVIIAKKA